MDMVETKVQVKVVNRTMVKPSRPSPESSMSLNALDLCFHHFPHNRRFLFYKLNSVQQYTNFIQVLSSSLSNVLSYFYPLAGRFKKLRETQPNVSNCSTSDPLLEVDCNNDGVPFVEAMVEGISFVELQQSNFAHQNFYNHLVPWIDPQDYFLVPPLIIQVSKFECGSVALGIALSHILCDGHSLWHFMNSWAECARGEPISKPPIHKRDLLKINIPQNTKHTKFFLEEDDDKVSDEYAREYLKLKVFCFSNEAINKLKIKAGGERTSYESLCAHIWKHINKARELMFDKKVSFIGAINMRNRLSPPLGDAYFGNGAILTSAIAKSGEIEDEDIGVIANRIHSSIHSCNWLKFIQWLLWLELYDHDAIMASVSCKGTRLRVSSSPHFPIHSVDFGFNKPLVARCIGVEGSSTIVLYCGSERGSIEASIMLPLHVMKKLENDPDFIDP